MKHFIFTVFGLTVYTVFFKDLIGSCELYYVTDGKDVLFRDFIGKLLETQEVNTAEIKSIPRWMALLMAKCMEMVYKTFIPMGTPVIDSEMIYTMGTAFTINDSKARTQLGYRNVITIEDGLAQL